MNIIHGVFKIYSNIKMTAASAASDADDMVFPLTPNSKKSTGQCRIANTSLEAESPLTSHSPEDQLDDTDTFLSYSQASPSRSTRFLDKMIGNIIYNEGTSESVEQQVGSNLMHLSKLS